MSQLDEQKPSLHERKPPRWGRGDLYATPLNDLSWKAQDSEPSLAAVFDHVRRDALEAANWYSRAKRPKRRVAAGARLLAIFAVGAATLLPLIDGVTAVTIPPLWVSIAIAVGAGAIGFDRFIGSSTGWIRYIKTELQIRDALEDFELEWQSQRAAWQGSDPSPEQVVAMLNRAKAFAIQINTIVQEETNAWAEEFQGAMKQIEDAIKAREAEAKTRTAATKSGGLNLVVTNGDQSQNGWQLIVDDGAETSHSGKTAAILDLSPGRHLIRLQGVIGGSKVQAQRIVNIASNATAQEEIVLS